MKQSMSFSARTFANWACGVAVAFTAVAASADVVLYEQAPINSGASYYADSDIPQQLADGFSVGNNPALLSTLSTISWWGGYGLGPVPEHAKDNFQVRVYGSISGTGILIGEFGSVATERSATGLIDGTDSVVFKYTYALPNPLDLPGGAHYLSVQNQTDGSFNWVWLTGSNGNSEFWLRGEDADDWGSQTGDLAFQLRGTPGQPIPEPGSLALLFLAGAGLSMSRRRRQ